MENLWKNTVLFIYVTNSFNDIYWKPYLSIIWSVWIALVGITLYSLIVDIVVCGAKEISYKCESTLWVRNRMLCRYLVTSLTVHLGFVVWRSFEWNHWCYLFWNTRLQICKCDTKFQYGRKEFVGPVKRGRCSWRRQLRHDLGETGLRHLWPLYTWGSLTKPRGR